MTPDLIWEDFSSAISDIVLSQRETKENSKTQLQKLYEQKELREKYNHIKGDFYSGHRMIFVDYRNGDYIHYGFKNLTIDEMITRVIYKKNREYQFLIMEAYEKFEDAIESIYAFLGKTDINFWPLSEYGDIKYNEICDLDFEFYANRAESRRGGAISIVKMLIDYFKCDCNANKVSLIKSIIFIENIRHVTVHCRGISIDKREFFERVAKRCGIYNNGNIDNDFLNYMNFFFGDGKYENLINITEERDHRNLPLPIEYSRFEMLLNPLLLCTYILCQESKKYVNSLGEENS